MDSNIHFTVRPQAHMEQIQLDLTHIVPHISDVGLGAQVDLAILQTHFLILAVAIQDAQVDVVVAINE